MYKNIAIIAAKNNIEAIKKKDVLVKKYDFKDITTDHKKIADSDLVIAVGGDGLMLHMLHEYEKTPLPIYGINCGTVGFLMNTFCEENFLEVLAKAQESRIHPLRMKSLDQSGEFHNHLAINEVALLRQSSQAAKIIIEIDGQERINYLAADGVLVSTAAGSTAYNLSAGGPIIPMTSKILALTPISPFRPKKWHGALLPSNCKVKFKVIDSESRPVSATADSNEVRNVKEVEVFEEKSVTFKILFDPNHSLEERIIREQFRN
jgi:NAD+ kinase